MSLVKIAALPQIIKNGFWDADTSSLATTTGRSSTAIRYSATEHSLTALDTNTRYEHLSLTLYHDFVDADSYLHISFEGDILRISPTETRVGTTYFPPIKKNKDVLTIHKNGKSLSVNGSPFITFTSKIFYSHSVTSFTSKNVALQDILIYEGSNTKDSLALLDGVVKIPTSEFIPDDLDTERQATATEYELEFPTWSNGLVETFTDHISIASVEEQEVLVNIKYEADPEFTTDNSQGRWYSYIAINDRLTLSSTVEDFHILRDSPAYIVDGEVIAPGGDIIPDLQETYLNEDIVPETTLSKDSVVSFLLTDLPEDDNLKIEIGVRGEDRHEDSSFAVGGG